MYLQELLGFAHPTYGHVPMLMSSDGRRLSKRDKDLDLGYLRSHVSAEKLIGVLAHAAGLLDTPQAISARELAGEFSWQNLRREDVYLDPLSMFV